MRPRNLVTVVRKIGMFAFALVCGRLVEDAAMAAPAWPCCGLSSDCSWCQAAGPVYVDAGNNPMLRCGSTPNGDQNNKCTSINGAEQDPPVPCKTLNNVPTYQNINPFTSSCYNPTGQTAVQITIYRTYCQTPQSTPCPLIIP